MATDNEQIYIVSVERNSIPDYLPSGRYSPSNAKEFAAVLSNARSVLVSTDWKIGDKLIYQLDDMLYIEDKHYRKCMNMHDTVLKIAQSIPMIYNGDVITLSIFSREFVRVEFIDDSNFYVLIDCGHRMPFIYARVNFMQQDI